MKRCCKCKQTLPIEDFHKNKSQSDGRQTYCKDCAKVRNAAYYRATPERNPQRRASRTKGREKARRIVLDHLLTHPCVDCGETDPTVLEFDHVRGEKAFNISFAISRGNPASLASEIAKCEVRCANCHRRVTAARGGFWRASLALDT